MKNIQNFKQRNREEEKFQTKNKLTKNNMVWSEYASSISWVFVIKQYTAEKCSMFRLESGLI